MPFRPRSVTVYMTRNSDTSVELSKDAVISRLSRTPAIARPGMINAERSIQWPMNLGHAPGSPSSTPHTDAEEGAVGQVLEATTKTYHDRSRDR